MISRRDGSTPTGGFHVFPTHPRRIAAFFLAAAGLALAACDGSNAFILDPTDPVTGEDDATAPTVQIELPASGATTVAAGDSVFVRARAADNRQIATLTFEGFALRGDASLGTQVAVPRYTKKVVNLGASVVRDTTVSRYLLATADSSSERNVLIVVTAADSAGNESKDTTLVNIGGPRITIMAPAPDAEFRSGTQLTVRLQAEDRNDQIRSVRLRATGAFTLDSLITLRASAPLVDTTLVIPIPNVQAGTLRLEATAVSGANITGNGRPVDVRITAPIPDTQAPRVTFDAAVQSRAESDDSIEVSVQAVDETRVDSVGATVLAIRHTATRADTVAVMHGRVQASAATFRFNLAALNLSGLAVDSMSFEVTAYAVDPARNCGASTTPLSAQSLPCRPGPQSSRLADIAGKEYLVFVARGSTIAYPHPGDVIADVVADGSRVYLSNFTWNRVDILPLGSNVYVDSVRVGSEPWGLAIGRFGDSLYVANSGGTNISVIPIRSGPLVEDQSRRIFTRNERLYSVELNSTGSVERVLEFDYSDRPQFLAQASNGLLVYSTRPSPAVADGTVRLFDPRKTRSEIFTGYVGRHTAQRAIVVNADSAFKIESLKWVRVCPRRRFGDAGDPPCIDGLPDDVSDSLTALRAQPANAAGGKWDTRLDMGAFIDEVGFADTTFVAASGDRDFVAVGEGARSSNARVPLFEADGDSLILRGDIRDLISNTGERVIGLGLNRDGSLGVARGNTAYFFTSTLRLQGVRESGSPTGGVAMHPEGVSYPTGPNRLAFVSGIEGGRPYIDVIDAFSFFRVKRIFIRDPVVGALVVAPRATGDVPQVNLRLYAITSRGLLSLRVTNSDLVP